MGPSRKAHPGAGPPSVETELFVRAVEKRFGVRLPRGMYSAVEKAGIALVEEGAARSLAEVMAWVVCGDEQNPVVRAMMETASIGETYFFRAPEQLRALRELVCEHVVRPKRASGLSRIRAWSAACATGEEAYTLAALLEEAAPGFTIQVVGTDMNSAALAKARLGRYSARSLRGLDPKDLPWLRLRGKLWEVDRRLRQLVAFVELNLVTDALGFSEVGLENFDVVLCRNVLIYIDGQDIPKVMAKLTKAAAPQAILGISPAEYSAARFATGFRDTSRGLLLRTLEGPGVVEPPKPPPPPPAPRERPPAMSAAGSFAPSAPQSIRGLPPTARQALDRATQAANQGAFEEAEAQIGLAVTLQPDWAHPYYLLAEILSARGDTARAIREFERALFLDRNMVAAELGLGAVLQRAGRQEEARRHYRRALRLLSDVPPDAIVEALGVTAEAVSRLIATVLAGQGSLP